MRPHPKITLALVAIIVLGLPLLDMLRKRAPLAAAFPASSSPAAMNPVASISASRGIETTRATQAFLRPERPLSPPIDPGDKTLRVVRIICAALAAGDNARHDLVFANLLPSLLALDPAAAGDLAEIWEPGPIRAELLRRVGQAWSGRDPAGAIKWADRLTDPDERINVLSDVCIQISQSAPRDAITLADRFDLPSTDRDTLETVAQLWAAKDPWAALDWARHQPPGDPRDRLMARIAFAEALSRPAEAARLVAEEMAPGQAQEEAFMSVLHEWGLHDHVAAAAWVGRVAEGALRERAVNELAGLAPN